MAKVSEQVANIRKRFNREHRILVFCRTKEEVESYASLLDGLAFHAGLLENERRVNSEQFRAGYIDVLCCSTAFGVGVDIPNIRYCIHVNSPYTMTNAVQETGRIGRDGFPAYSFIFFNSNSTEGSSQHLRGKDKIFDLLRLPNQCLRAFICAQYDLLPSSCFLVKDANPCQFCRRSGAFDKEAMARLVFGEPQANPIATPRHSYSPANASHPTTRSQQNYQTIRPTHPTPTAHQPSIAAHPHSQQGASVSQRIVALSVPPELTPTQSQPQSGHSEGRKHARPDSQFTDRHVKPKPCSGENFTSSQYTHSSSSLGPSLHAEMTPKNPRITSFRESDKLDFQRRLANAIPTSQIAPQSSQSTISTFSDDILSPPSTPLHSHTVEKYRRIIEVQRKAFNTQQSMRAWDNLQKFMMKHQSNCWWCMQPNWKCYSPNSRACRIVPGNLTEEFQKWQKYLKDVYKNSQTPGYANNCAWCQMPSAYAHNYNRDSVCGPASDNTVSTVWLILSDNHWHKEIIKTYPEVSEMYTTVCRDWLTKDPLKCGNSGMVRVLEWWFEAVCQKSLLPPPT